MVTRRIERTGVGIHLTAVGDGPRTPMLMTHGFSATSRMFARTAAALGSARRCLTWDVRGHGQSDSPADPSSYSVGLTVADMVAILDAEGIERAVLLGHSMGGFLSLSFQLAQPARVAGLVLVGTGPGYRKDDARAGWNDLCESFARSLEDKGLDGLPEASTEMEASAHRGADGLVHAARGILRQHDSRVLDHLPEIDVPTLIVVGEQDRPFVGGSRYMAAKIPGARLVVMEGAGHAPMLTHTDAFVGHVRGFLEDAGL